MRLLLILAAVLWMQPRRIDLHAMPWGHALDLMVDDGPDAARRYLEDVGRSPRPGWERAHAWVWAGRLALRDRKYPEADREFRAAMTVDPGGTDARWGALGAADVAIATRRWIVAEHLLGGLVNDAEPGVRAYARDRELQIRGELRRPYLRWGAIVAACLAWSIVLAAAWRRREGLVRRFGRALLVTEAAALGGAFAVNRFATPLAQPGWMAGAVPGAVLVALAWSSRAGSHPGSPLGWKRAAVGAVVALGCAGLLYTAFDLTWWSVH